LGAEGRSYCGGGVGVVVLVGDGVEDEFGDRARLAAAVWWMRRRVLPLLGGSSIWLRVVPTYVMSMWLMGACY
jgi:hypothetical protein